MNITKIAIKPIMPIEKTHNDKKDKKQEHKKNLQKEKRDSYEFTTSATCNS